MATTAVHGSVARIFINQFDVSNQLKTSNIGNQSAEIETTAFQDTARTYIPNYRDGTIGLEGFWASDPVALDKIGDIFLDLVDDTSPAVVTIAPEGAASVGKRALLCSGVETKADMQVPATNYISAMADFRGPVDSGVILAPIAAVTVTGNGTSVDNAAATTNGGVGHLHIITVTGGSPTNTTKVQHSVNNSTWVDLLAFTAKTAAGSQRVVVAAGTTVNRYLRELHTLDGSSSFTQSVAFARL